MTVLLGARDLDKGLHAARKLAGAPGEVIAVQLDVTQQDQVDTLARWIEITYGRLDVLVNNAGAPYDPAMRRPPPTSRRCAMRWKPICSAAGGCAARCCR